MEKEICLIECIFGRNYTDVYQAPFKEHSFLFSNNKKLKTKVEKFGWKFVFIDMPLSKDFAMSSFQSKYVKFLQFLKEDRFSGFFDYKYILYSDHKHNITKDDIYKLLEMSNKPMLVRNYMNNQRHLWTEIYTSMNQARYLRYMPQTIDWVREKIKQGYEDNPPIFLTGLFLYDISSDNKSKLFNFVDETYCALTTIGTSQCQIICSMIAQKYYDVIQIADYESIDIKNHTPRSGILKIAKKYLSKNTILALRKWRNKIQIISR